MHKIETNHKKNQMVILLNEFQSSNRELFVSDIEQAATNLPLGFSCILILSKDTIVSGKELQDIEDLLYAYGLKTMVYVGEHHDSLFRHKGFSCQTDIRINQVNTIEEAEEVLSTQAVQ
jgi:hypothetical protein